MPWLYNRAGGRFRTEHQVEITRLKAAGYREQKEPVPTVEDLRFHPADKNVQEVLQYLGENPEDADRVVAEEKAGKARTTITQHGE